MKGIVRAVEGVILALGQFEYEPIKPIIQPCAPDGESWQGWAVGCKPVYEERRSLYPGNQAKTGVEPASMSCWGGETLWPLFFWRREIQPKQSREPEVKKATGRFDEIWRAKKSVRGLAYHDAMGGLEE